MRIILYAVALLVAAGPALAGGAEEFFLGRPPSVGVVHGGAFGLGGSDYTDEMRPGPFAAPRAVRTARTARGVAHVGRVHRTDGPTIAARPYFRP